MTTPTPTPLPAHKTAFLHTAHSLSALKFNSTPGFVLKSGRLSPYFFNAGLFHRAAHFSILTTSYAQTLHAHLQSTLPSSNTHGSDPSSPPFTFDVLFGPAYKGIPLAAAVVTKLADIDAARYGEVSYSFNRKEAKAHGEGGSIVGAPLAGKRVVIIDDVITAGTAIREAIEIIKAEGGELVGIVVAFDRQEKMPAREGEEEDAPRGSAIGEVRREYGVPVLAILTLDDVVAEGGKLGTEEDRRRLEEYRAKYRASD